MIWQRDDALRKDGREKREGGCGATRKKVAAPKSEYVLEDDSLGKKKNSMWLLCSPCLCSTQKCSLENILEVDERETCGGVGGQL